MADRDPIDRYSAQELLNALQDSVNRLGIRIPTEAVLGDWYAGLVKRAKKAIDRFYWSPSTAMRTSDWLFRPASYPPSDKWWFETRTVFDLAREIDAWVSFQADNADA